jgi:hypothetical protein
MDHPNTFTAWAALGLACLAPTGALFGGVAGAIARAAGHSPGCPLGRAAARRVARLSEKELSPALEGAIVGAVDGTFFLGVVGILVGLVAGYGGSSPNLTIVLIAGIALAVLAVAAVAFGLVALGLVRGGLRGLVLFCCTGIGALLGLGLSGELGAIWGLVGGGMVGLLGAALHRPEA